jgi:uncharacterized protein
LRWVEGTRGWHKIGSLLIDYMNVLIDIARECWSTFTAMAPYLLFGFAIAGALSVLVPQETVERHLGDRGMLPVLKAALVGVPLPLCSCSVIPVAMSLRRHGSSRGATVSFLLSTPQTGVDSIVVTYSLLGPVFAIFRPLAALLTGVLGGFLTDRLQDGAAGGQVAPPERCTEECCSVGPRQNRFIRALRHGFLTLPHDIGKALLLGVLIAGVIAAFVPDDFFAGVLGTGIAGILVMMLLGIPVYVCATASVPIAVALMAKGASPGAALAFLIAGPATNAATIMVIWKELGRRTALIYLGTVAFAAVLCGLALNRIFAMPGMSSAHMHHEMLPSWVGTAGAVALLIVIGVAILRPARKDDPSGVSHVSDQR